MKLAKLDYEKDSSSKVCDTSSLQLIQFTGLKEWMCYFKCRFFDNGECAEFSMGDNKCTLFKKGCTKVTKAGYENFIPPAEVSPFYEKDAGAKACVDAKYKLTSTKTYNKDQCYGHCQAIGDCAEFTLGKPDDKGLMVC